MPYPDCHAIDHSGTHLICRKILPLVCMTICSTAFLLLSSCYVISSQEQSGVSVSTDKGSDINEDGAAAMDKVDPEVRAMIDRIGDADPKITATAPNSLSTLSSSSLRVDDGGRIQLYIYVSRVDEDSRQLLNEAGAEIELENHELKVYQAWVPATAVHAVAAADVVDKITPPSYASYR